MMTLAVGLAPGVGLMIWTSLAGLGIFFGASFGGPTGSVGLPGTTVPSPALLLPQQVSWQQRRLWNQSRSREKRPCRQESQLEPHEPLQPLSQQSLWNRSRKRSSSLGLQLSQQVVFGQAGLHSVTHFGLHS
jgi:hypothetical protein